MERTNRRVRAGGEALGQEQSVGASVLALLSELCTVCVAAADWLSGGGSRGRRRTLVFAASQSGADRREKQRALETSQE